MGGGGAANRAAERARADEMAREERVKKGTAALRYQFGERFTEPYFENIGIEGRNLYGKQIGKQYDESLRDLQSALARSGLSNSKTAVKMDADLTGKLNQAQQDMQSNVAGIVNQRRQAVANAEQTAVGQLHASADPAAAAAQAANAINIQSKPESWSPLGQVFTDVSAGLATQAQLEREGNARYNMGVSKWGGNTRRFLQNVGT